MPVANSPEELALLKAVVDQPANFERKFEYACHLVETNDARGDLLHAAIDNKTDADKFPKLEAVSQSWLDVTGVSIIKHLLDADLSSMLEPILRLARPTLKLVPSDAEFDSPPETPTQIGQTRLGGDPDLASEYPKTAEGRPFVFIGQFNLKNLRGSVVEDYFPESGLLSLFRTPTVHSVACFPEKDDLPKLVQFAGDSSTLKRVSRPPETWDGDPEDASDPKGRPPSVHMPYRANLSIKETLSLPQDLSRWLDAEDDRFYDLDFDHDPFRLLGYCEHNNSGDDLLFGKPKLVQLMRLPSSEGPDYGMTDGSFSIFVSQDDLKAGNFQRVKTSFG